MSPFTNPLVLRAALLLFGATFAFGLGLFLMRLLRKALLSESENIISNSLEESSNWRKDN
jgi:hypothetical protein